MTSPVQVNNEVEYAVGFALNPSLCRCARKKIFGLSYMFFSGEFFCISPSHSPALYLVHILGYNVFSADIVCTVASAFIAMNRHINMQLNPICLAANLFLMQMSMMIGRSMVDGNAGAEREVYAVCVCMCLITRRSRTYTFYICI